MKKQINQNASKASCFYDGGCPLCRIEINAMKKQDKCNAIKWFDITKDQQALTDVGVSYKQAMDNIHVLDDCDQLVTGVDGFLAVWKHLPYYRNLVPIVKWKPIYFLFNAAYFIFARYRLTITRRKHTYDNNPIHTNQTEKNAN